MGSKVSGENGRFRRVGRKIVALFDGIEESLSRRESLGTDCFLCVHKRLISYLVLFLFHFIFFSNLQSEMGTVFERVCERVSSPPVGMSLERHRNG
jgi:hypothetical protein